ncbi:hypothetical protein PIB30_078603 [Stylosanthes scabra]|uniref:Uncharacterized protein n=1 Tax=Stylosanthes scabra TaxID=79078 RepID=A0ABU6WQL6_9FABA|nr:hypothetical protein [Stylosanthes scabra]
MMLFLLSHFDFAEDLPPPICVLDVVYTLKQWSTVSFIVKKLKKCGPYFSLLFLSLSTVLQIGLRNLSATLKLPRQRDFGGNGDMVAVFQCSPVLRGSINCLIWKKPSLGMYKVNCSASLFYDDHRAGFGCALRNDSGEWMKGCSGAIPPWSIHICEIFAI